MISEPDAWYKPKTTLLQPEENQNSRGLDAYKQILAPYSEPTAETTFSLYSTASYAHEEE